MNHRAQRYAIGAAILFFLIMPPTASVTAQTKVTAHTPAGVVLPTHITIETAKVDADVIDIGVTKKGNLDVPGNYTQTGWYRYGAIPGMNGNAVIDGHVDNGGKTAGPFKHLKDAKIGDLVTVAMTDGSQVVFQVTDSSVYKNKDFPGETIFHGATGSVLTLITCHGKFVSKLGTYDQRLVVTAIRV